MELREHWTILRRRIWIPLTLMALTLALSLWQLRPWQPVAPVYNANMRLLVGVLPSAQADVTAYDPRYYSWLTSEYLVDDFTEVVRSALFAERVSARLADQSIAVPAGLIQGSAATGKLHRIITLSFAMADPAQIEAVANAAVAELSEDATFYFQQLGTEGAGVTLIDGPTIGVVGRSLRDRLDLPLRLFLAFVVGVGIAYLLEYLDDSVRSARDLQALGLPWLGSIPRKRK